MSWYGDRVKGSTTLVQEVMLLIFLDAVSEQNEIYGFIKLRSVMILFHTVLKNDCILY